MDLLSHLPVIIGSVLGLAAVLFLATRFFVNVGPTQIAIIEKRFIGGKLPANRAFATSGEVGIQAKYLEPGLHPIFWPFVRVIERSNFLKVEAGELGVVTAVDGESMPSGRVYAEDKAGDHHGNFQDPVAFLTQGGVRGKQLRFLTNGTYKIHPRLFVVEKIAKTVVPEGKIGLVTAADGASLGDGQLLGKRVEGHDNFQKAEIFIKSGGQKGPQIDHLRPGTYNIFADMFKVDFAPAVRVKENELGVVEAKSGEPMAHEDVVAQTPDMGIHKSYQDGQAFLDNGGKRGPQEAVLRPGDYYINPYLFSVTMRAQTVIAQGEVAVLISNIGKDPSSLPVSAPAGQASGQNPSQVPSQPGQAPLSGSATDPDDARFDTGVRTRHVVPDGYRGIQKTVLGPGNYNINPLSFTVIKVPTTTRSIEWSENQSAKDFDPFLVYSKDGFEMKVEVRCQYRILPENAPYVVQKLGSVTELEKNVLHPQIDGIFRAQVSKSPAMNYQSERMTEQTEAEEAVRQDLKQYKVEIVSVMISNIVLPKELMHTTQEKNLAQQRESMYDAQKKAEEKRIAFEETKAQADQQPAIIRAEAGIKIAQHEAKQMEERAKGTAAQTRIEADATAGKVKIIGDAEAGVIESKGNATAEAYRKQGEALTPAGITSIEVVKLISAAGLKIVPDVVAGGDSSNGGGGGLVNLLLADMVQRTRNADGKASGSEKSTASVAPVAPAAAAPAPASAAPVKAEAKK
jgi:regulator of protease activity HflC (stomatin/prohibitin superfamily)